MSETGQQRPTSRPRAGGPDARRPGPPSPQGSPQGEPRQSATRFAMLLALARGAVAWENIWPAVWPLAPCPGIDRKSTRLTPVTNAPLVCRLLLEKKKHIHKNIIRTHIRSIRK